ncbi:MAG: cohesin domain-containing protein, partial [bacterium]
MDYDPWVGKPRINIIPISGLLGITITLEGKDFATQTEISISFGTHPTITTTQSNNIGTFSTTFIVSTQPPGTKVITATDSYGNYATTVFILLPPTFLRVIPQSRIMAKGDEFNVDVKIDDVRELAAAQVYLLFNPGVLEVRNITPGSFPPLAMNTYNTNTSGCIYYFAGLFTGSASGSGILFSARFKGKEAGTSSLKFGNNTILANAMSQSISFNKDEGLFYVAESIRVYPENKTIKAGEREGFSCFAQCGPGSIDVTGSTTFTADGGGSFTANSFEAHYIGTYTITGTFLSLMGTTSVIITPGTPTTLLYVSGNNQTQNCTETLTDPFIVKVEDFYYNPCYDVLIDWVITENPSGASGFSLSATQTLTNINGTSGTYLTLGTEPPGTYTIEARNPSLSGSPIIFNAYSLRRFGSISGLCLIDKGTEAQRQAGILVRLVETGETKTTNANSYFIFSNIPVGIYTLAFTYPGATPATKTDVLITKTQFNDTTEIGTITLIAGDPNGDGQINILDWPPLADSLDSNIGSPNYNPNCDFNADGVIDIWDFMIFRDNFGETQTTRTRGIRGLAAKSSGNITLKFEPDIIENAKPGDVITLNILISEARNSLCGEIHLTYDKEMLEPTQDKLQLGNWPTQATFTLKNRVKDGKIDYAFGLRKPETSEGGILASLSFIIKKTGNTKLLFDNDLTSNRKTMFIERTGSEDQLPNVEQEPIEIDAPLIPNTILLPSFPNPAKTSCWIPFKLSKDAYCKLEVFNILGQKIRTIDIGFRKKGSYTKAKEGSAIFFEGKNNNGEPLSSGL